MKEKIYHGEIQPQTFARALVAEFNDENIRAQQFTTEEGIIVQIATRANRRSGGKTTLTVSFTKVEDGLSVRVGNQSMFGVAASLGRTALSAVRSPFNLLWRLDDLAQDIESLQLDERVWEVIANVAEAADVSLELSERLRRVVCDYCETPNPVGEASCVACGAPLGNVQPTTCPHCGFVVRNNELRCPRCAKPLS
jgi:RNase P subunit RPR2